MTKVERQALDELRKAYLVKIERLNHLQETLSQVKDGLRSPSYPATTLSKIGALLEEREPWLYKEHWFRDD